MTATLKGETLALTTAEFSLLRALAERSGRVLSREQLLELVHGNAEESWTRLIDVRVSRLRHELRDDPRNPRRLKTVRGVGYVLTLSDPVTGSVPPPRWTPMVEGSSTVDRGPGSRHALHPRSCRHAPASTMRLASG